jgi:hypothetical protein
MLLHFAITPAAEIKRRYLYAKFIDGLHNKSSYTEETRNDEKFNPNRFKQRLVSNWTYFRIVFRSTREIICNVHVC